MKKKGFTLIELLVVIAIIGILSSVVVVSLNSARAKARDAKRVADLEAVKAALSLYFDTNQAYPATLAGIGTEFLASQPVPPTANEVYLYVPSADGLSYHLGATLEQAGHTSLSADRDCSSGEVTEASPACNGFAAPATGGFAGVDPIYDVTP
ncbi:MAG TPA: type II secretion system protein [Candidatus Paceibacterota bacterium]|nr:type II secretion system protein [Candidatus Paceibacterota bacterium]